MANFDRMLRCITKAFAQSNNDPRTPAIEAVELGIAVAEETGKIADLWVLDSLDQAVRGVRSGFYQFAAHSVLLAFVPQTERAKLRTDQIEEITKARLSVSVLRANLVRAIAETH